MSGQDVMTHNETPAVSGHGDGHESHAAPGGHGSHGGQGGHGHGGHGHGGHGDHVAMFRRRFWWSLLLTVPMVVTSHMVMDWFGYEIDFPGMSWVGPVLGTVV